MVKKLKVWLNNKLNKCLHCTVVIKFYCTFVTELVFTFFVFKYQNHFEFPKDGKPYPGRRCVGLWPSLKIPAAREKNLLKFLGGGGPSKTPWNRKSWGWGCKSKSLPWRGYRYFNFWNHTLTNRVFIFHCSRNIVFSQCRNYCFQRYTITCNQFSRDNGTTDGSCKHWPWFFFTLGLSFTDLMLCKA